VCRGEVRVRGRKEPGLCVKVRLNKKKRRQISGGGSDSIAGFGGKATRPVEGSVSHCDRRYTPITCWWTGRDGFQVEGAVSTKKSENRSSGQISLMGSKKLQALEKHKKEGKGIQEKIDHEVVATLHGELQTKVTDRFSHGSAPAKEAEKNTQGLRNMKSGIGARSSCTDIGENSKTNSHGAETNMRSTLSKRGGAEGGGPNKRKSGGEDQSGQITSKKTLCQFERRNDGC